MRDVWREWVLGVACFSTRAWFLVRVPVLSEQRIDIPASSSIAESRATTAFFSERCFEPTAIVVVHTTCIAIGIKWGQIWE